MATAETYFQEGLKCREQGKWHEAINYYQKAIALQPNQAIYYCQLAEAQLAIQDSLSAINTLETALKLLVPGPVQAYAYWLLGNAYRHNGWQELAVETYAKALAIDPEGFTVEAHLFLGDIYSDRQQYVQAYSVYRQALQLEPNNPTIYSRILQNYLKQNDLENATKLLQQIADIDPEFLQAKDIVDLGIKYLELQQLDTAENLFHQAITIQSNYGLAHYYLGQCFEQKNSLREAILSYREAIEYDPQLAVAYEKLGYLLQQFHQTEEANACLEAAKALRSG